jgi:hypothetical protein
MSKLAVLLILASVMATAQAPRASMADQRLCSDQAKKVFEQTKKESESKSDDYVVPPIYISHYDPKIATCFVRIDSRMIVTKSKTAKEKTEVGVWFEVLDAFELTEYATYMSFSEHPDWLFCYIKPKGKGKISCRTTDEFDSLVESTFGLTR